MYNTVNKIILFKNMPNIEKRLDKMEKNIETLVETVMFIKDNAVSHDEYQKDKDELKKDINFIKSQMVTKDYLDTKLADLRGELVSLVRKEDTKVKTVVDILKKKKTFTNADATQIYKMEPFAQVM